ncbi:hypothetical protein [Neptunomonas sp.]
MSEQVLERCCRAIGALVHLRKLPLIKAGEQSVSVVLSVQD